MDEFQNLTLHKISAGSVFKIHLLGLLCSLVPLGVLNGILSAIGITVFTLRWNGEIVHGFSALILSPLLFLLLALVVTGIIGSLTWLGLWIYGQFRELTLRIVPAGDNREE